MTVLHQLKDKAARAAAKGQFAKAAELYLRIADDEAGDPDWRRRAGEALRRAGDEARALEQLELASASYARRGFAREAIATCKVMLKIAPGHRWAEEMLGLLEAKQAARVAPPATRPKPPAAPLQRPPAVYAPPPRMGRVAEPLIGGGRAELVRLEERRRGYTPMATPPEPPRLTPPPRSPSSPRPPAPRGPRTTRPGHRRRDTTK